MVRGIWEGDKVALFDERIIDADAPCYQQANLTWKAISNRAAQAKKEKHQGLAEELSCFLYTTDMLNRSCLACGVLGIP